MSISVKCINKYKTNMYVCVYERITHMNMMIQMDFFKSLLFTKNKQN